jgi:hypothetical protein
MRTRDRVRQLLEEGKGVKEIARILGISQGTVGYHKRRLDYPLDERFTVRYDWPAIQAYYDEGHSECGISEWRDRPLSLELHHRNGEKHDNRLENLALLCPNCHSQTDSWGGRNVAVAEEAAGATVTALRPPPGGPDSAA